MDLTDEVVTAIFEMLSELSSELDLHYEDEDFFALKPTIEKMQNAARILSHAGMELPDSYKHVLSRYNKKNN
jgi:hypothetical protein